MNRQHRLSLYRMAGPGLIGALSALSACAQQDPSTPAKTVAPVYTTDQISGLFYMQKYWIATRNLEKAVWYFAPDGVAYYNPQTGFAAEDLAAVASSKKGPYSVSGGRMTVQWGDGQKSDDEIKIVDGGFNWNTGMYLPVAPFESAAELVGSYEGGSSVSFSGNSTIIVKSLTLNADGTFSLEGASSLTNGDTRTGGQSATQGKWSLSGYALALTDDAGKVVRGITFPLDDAATPSKPDRMFFAGVSYAKK